jgi:hypothetical protein
MPAIPSPFIPREKARMRVSDRGFRRNLDSARGKHPYPSLKNKEEGIKLSFRCFGLVKLAFWQLLR